MREHHCLVLVRRHLAERAATQVSERAKALIAMGGDLEPRFADSIRKVRFVPFDWAECFVEGPHLLHTRAPHDPRTNHDVDFGQPYPVEWPVPDARHHVLRIVKILPTFDGISEREQVETTDQTQQPNLRVSSECLD